MGITDELLQSAPQPSVGPVGEDEEGLPGRKPLSELRKMFDDYRTTTETNRTQTLIDYDYYDGKQLTPDEVATLKQRGQPDIVVNRTRVAINGILGVTARSHTDPKCWPRSPDQNDSASIATDCLKYVKDFNNFDRIKVEQSKDNYIGGTNALLVGIDDDGNVTYTPINNNEYFHDPRARRLDLADKRYDGMAKWMYSDDVEVMYPETAKGLGEMVSGGMAGLGLAGESFEDRPINQGWLDYRRKRVMVVEMYYRAAQKWYKACFWYAGILDQGEVEYLDKFKKSVNPIISESCYVDRDNNRYGLIRDMRDLQDEVNKRRSKLLHILNSSQIQARDPSAIEVDAEVARSEAARPDGVLPFGWEKVPNTDHTQGQALLLTEAKNELERFGPNPAVLGRQGADSSGRALLARQQAGLIELAVVLDQMEDWELRVYRATWDRIRQFWKAPMYVRVSHDPNAPQFVGINQPIPNPEAGQPVMDPATGQPQMDPETQGMVMHSQVLGYENQVAEMDVDIRIDTAPATATIMQEQLKDLMALVSSNPTYAEQVPFEVFFELMPIPHKAQITSQIKTYREGQQQKQQAMQQQQIELAVQEHMSKIGLTQSKAELNKAKTAETIAGIPRDDAVAHAGVIKDGVAAHKESAELTHAVTLSHAQAALARDKLNLEREALEVERAAAAGRSEE